MNVDIFNGLGIDVVLESEDDFLKIKETLSRIGIASRKTTVAQNGDIIPEKVLWPSVYILHKRGEYRIMHFKELFLMDNRPSDISESDVARRNTIALLLDDWGLLKITNKDNIKNNVVNISKIKILTHREKPEWDIIHKYSIGSSGKRFNK